MPKQCYWIQSNKVIAGPSPVPCGPPNAQGHSQCCVSGDSCHADGFCYSPQRSAAPSGWYLAACTDKTYADSSCPLSCKSLARSAVVYNYSTGSWACCSNNSTTVGGNADCDHPTNMLFSAPSPEILLANGSSDPTLSTSISDPATSLSSSASKSSSYSTSSSKSTFTTSQFSSVTFSTAMSSSISLPLSTASSTTSSTVISLPSSALNLSPISNPNELNISAKVAIATSTTVFTIVLLCFIALLVIRRRRKRQPAPVSVHELHGKPQEKPYHTDETHPPPMYVAEIDGRERRQDRKP